MSNVQPSAPTRIVVGVDGSDQSQQALRSAARIASVTHADIDAIAVWDYPTTTAGHCQRIGIPAAT